MTALTFPRLVHKAGAHLRVATDEAYELALRDGWSADPVAVTVVKGDDSWVVYTADSLATALADGWTVSSDTEAVEDAPIVDAPARKRSKK
jgi:hypothetical protein